MARKILPFFPEHECYVEVFGGSGALLFAKEPSKYEKYNDIDGDLVNLFRQVRDNPRGLEKKLRLLPQSRVEYAYLRDDNTPLSDLERAVRIYYLYKNGFSGKPGGCFSVSANHKGKYDMWVDLYKWSKRLRRVAVECLDFSELIPKYDEKSVFFFLDPPYYDVARYYQQGFTKNDHERLRDSLRSITGNWLMTYNDCDWVRRAYRGFNLIETPVYYSSALIRKRTKELIIANYPMEVS